MAYMSSHTNILSGDMLPEHKVMLQLFSKAAKLPQVLFTQNSIAMQSAFMKVSQSVWMERLNDLQTALQARNTTEGVRRFLVICRNNNLRPRTEELLNAVFLQKYDELIDKVKYDYDGFFPYRITKMNQKLLVFEKLTHSELIEYILSHKP